MIQKTGTVGAPILLLEIAMVAAGFNALKGEVLPADVRDSE
jgi:hypothetical protein